MSEQELITVEEAAHRLSIGRTKMYELLQAGEIDSVKIGRRVGVVLQSMTDWIAKMSRAATYEDTDENGDPRWIGRS